MSNIYDITQLGAADGQDSTTAFQQAINLALQSSKGGEIYVPGGGIYFCETQLSYTLQAGQSLLFKGDGAGFSTIKWPNANGGIALTAPGGNYTTGNTSIQGLTLKTAVSGGGTAYSLTQTGNTMPGPVKNFDDVVITGNGIGGYWNDSIILDGCTNPAFSRVRINGYQNGLNFYGNGPTLKNSQSNHAVDASFDEKCYFWQVDTGLSVNAGVEGVAFRGKMVNCNKGISWIQPSGVVPLLSLVGAHINAAQYGVFTEGVAQINAIGNTFYRYILNSAGKDFAAVYVDNISSPGNSDADKWIGNHMQGFTVPGTNSNGLVYRNGCNGTIALNSADNFDTPVWLQPGTTGMKVLDNSATNCPNPILNQGTGNIIR